MRERQREFAFDFNRSLRVGQADQRLSSNGGALLLREVDQRLGLMNRLVNRLQDGRSAAACEYSLREVLRSWLLAMALGDGSQSGMERLRDDPIVRLAATDRRGVAAIERSLPSQPTCSRLLANLASRDNRHALLYAPMEMAIAAHQSRRKARIRYVTVDLDSTDFETHGQQELATYNGYYGHTCYHGLVASIAETADLCGLWARKGSVSSAKGTNAFLRPILDRLDGTIGQVLDVRFDAAFATPAVMDELDARDINFVGRLRSNSNLQELASPILQRL